MEIISEVFSLVSVAYAQGAAAAPNQPGFAEVFSKMMPMFAIVFLIFYFMVIKPQQNKLKYQENLIKGLKKGDQVVTSGGIIAKVTAIEEDCVVLELSNNVRMKVEKQHISKLKDNKAAEQKSAA